ncbi:hypothetical protein [Owenweeksia hongkongensis]|uniref:DUF4252 domain-containing protein n=1 Tax=Owenweeksia hongkongensis (strain DSM 17368 / CIP 108786 / JCM 12287 / NRRL B-23963 / UST20020801) TaxID=926562 RepID=G8R2V5_OWEHD|nr:hypothetical protein [Owenweeksia hongkongensis]AEV31910.1 hypothetical protein Oweho_0899 [Owenweeksia hongkongensis DSM 17368]
MKYLFLLITLFTINVAHAQTQEDFDEMGRKVLSMVTDSVPAQTLQFIRRSEYFEVIDKQPISDNQKSILKQKLNVNLSDQHSVVQNSLTGLRETYEVERKEGATFEYHETIYELMDRSVDTYTAKTTYLYKSGKTQTLVSFIYDVAWLGNRFVLIGEIKEDF